MAKSDSENFSISLDPRLIKFIDTIAYETFSSRSHVISEALRVYIRLNRIKKEDGPQWWDKYYQETFEESN